MTEDRTQAQAGALRTPKTLPFLLLALILLAVMYWWTAGWMVARWEQPGGEYGHGWLILLCSGVLLAMKRRQIAACPLRPRAWGLALVVPALLVHLAATAWRVGFLSGFALLPLLVGLVVALLGTEMLRVVFFPLAFLAFMIPLPEYMLLRLSFNLKLFAATLATHVIGALGLAAVREGSYIRIPSGTVLVDDVCSGLKYLISLTAFGALCAYISRLNRAGKAVLLLLSAPFAVLANVLRVILMILVAFAFGVEATEAWFFHDVFGLLLFVVAFAMLFSTEALLLKIPGWDRRKPSGEGEAAPGSEPNAPKAPAAPQPRATAAPLSAMGALLLAAAASLFLAWPREDITNTDIVSGIPSVLGEWRGNDHVLEDKVYELLGTRNVISRVYENDERSRVLVMIIMANQARKRTHPPEQCVVGEGYEILRSSNHEVNLDSPGGDISLQVREMLLRRGNAEQITWYFFKSGPRLSTSYWGHQAGLALRKLTDPNAVDVLVRVETVFQPGNPDPARQKMADLLAELMPPITKVFP